MPLKLRADRQAQIATMPPLSEPVEAPAQETGVAVPERDKPFYGAHVQICNKTKRDGSPCAKPVQPGLKVCFKHGGAAPEARKVTERAKLNRRLRAGFLEPIPEDDPEADILHGFQVTYRQCVGNMRYFAGKLAELVERDDEALIWGMLTNDTKTGFEAGEVVEFTAEKHGAAVNLWWSLYAGERKTLIEMQKVWIAQGLAEKHLEIEASLTLMLNDSIVAAIRALGHDVNDPKVRAAVRDALTLLPGASRIIEA